MSKKKSGSSRETNIEVVVGVFVALIFVALAVFTIVVSGASLFNNSSFKIEAVLPDAMGLRRNDPVIAKGTTVGTVSDVYYSPEGVHVVAELVAPVKFYEDYTITVVTTSILGGRQLVIKEGSSERAVVEDVMDLKGIKPSDMMEDATAAIQKVREFLETDTLSNLQVVSQDLSDISGRLNRGEGTLGRLLSADDEMYTNLNATVSNFRLITDRLEAGEGTLGRLLSSDDEIYTNLNATVANFRSMTDRLEAGEGTLGRLLSSDDEMYTNLNATVSNLRAITDRLEAGEGTLGKLLSTDTHMYDNIDGAVTDVREMLDDAREANTLSTFTSILFSGF